MKSLRSGGPLPQQGDDQAFVNGMISLRGGRPFPLPDCPFSLLRPRLLARVAPFPLPDCLFLIRGVY